MTRSELLRAIARRFPQLGEADVRISVMEILQAVTDTMAARGRVEIRGFGSFGLNHRAARSSRNPKTGEAVAVPAKYTPHFKAGKDLAQRVNP